MPQRRLERASVQLVERVGADPDAQEEGAQRRDKPTRVERRRNGRAYRDVAQVPCGVRRMQQRDQIAPAAAREGVESGTVEPTARGVHPSP